VASTAPGGRTNDVVGVVNGIKQKLLGGSGIVVSEVGLGTQRWVSADFNAPDEREVFRMMDLAIRDGGVNLIDTAEQYPIPSDDAHPEGLAEATIGKWLATDKALRAKTVIATKIGGGQRISGKNIITACEDSLRRLGTDYIDVYQFHWPARYTPQSNWGQSLSYRPEMERRSATWEEQCIAMDKLYREGKIRGWGSCNDNAFGLTMLAETARRLGTVPPCSFQNDFSVLNRRTEQDGLAEASRPQHANAGFMAYNCLAGGVLTGKYLEVPAAVDDFGANPDRARLSMKAPRGRMDDMSWGQTLYRYRTKAALDATKQYAKIAKRAGMPLTELSLRWAKDSPQVTTVLLGTASVAQLTQDLEFFRRGKPLPDQVRAEIDAVHMRNRLPLFSNDRYEADWDNQGQIGEPVP